MHVLYKHTQTKNTQYEFCLMSTHTHETKYFVYFKKRCLCTIISDQNSLILVSKNYKKYVVNLLIRRYHYQVHANRESWRRFMFTSLNVCVTRQTGYIRSMQHLFGQYLLKRKVRNLLCLFLRVSTH